MPAGQLTYVFRSHKKLGGEFGRIAREISAKARGLEEPPLGAVEDAVHDGRVLIKRLRALLWFAKPILPKSVRLRAKERLRKSSGLLSGQRDFAVARETLKALDSDQTKYQGKPGLTKIIGKAGGPEMSIKKQRETLKKAMILLRRCAENVGRNVRSYGQWPSPNERVTEALHNMKNARAKAWSSKKDRDFHQWRKMAKRFFYLLELTSPDPDFHLEKATSQADQLQDILGQHHDVAVLEATITERKTDSAGNAELLKLLRERKAHLAKMAHRLRVRI
jgi:CHAD domain-containing protein